MATMEAVLEDPTILIPPNVKELPTYLEVVRVVDLGSRVKGARTFVEDVSIQFPKFYHDAGQVLTKWVAQAPKIKENEQKQSSIPVMYSELSDVAPSVDTDVITSEES